MIIIINSKTKPEKVSDLVNWIERKGLKTHITEGDYQNIIGVIGDTSRIDEDQVKSFDIVEAVKRVSEPFKQAVRGADYLCRAERQGGGRNHAPRRRV